MNRKHCALFIFGLTLCALHASSAHAEGGKGMTWGKMSHDSNLGIDQVGCQNGTPTGCNAYRGETSCLASRATLGTSVSADSRSLYCSGVRVTTEEIRRAAASMSAAASGDVLWVPWLSSADTV